jgi:hypothetical protein
VPMCACVPTCASSLPNTTQVPCPNPALCAAGGAGFGTSSSKLPCEATATSSLSNITQCHTPTLFCALQVGQALALAAPDHLVAPIQPPTPPSPSAHPVMGGLSAELHAQQQATLLHQVCVCTCAQLCVHVHVHVYVCVCMCLHMCVYVSAQSCVLCAQICVCARVCECV